MTILRIKLNIDNTLHAVVCVSKISLAKMLK